MQKTNLRRSNLRRVFRIIQKQGPIERKQIQMLSQLSWGAVSQFTTMLVNAGIVSQDLNPVGNVGKTPLTLDINKNNHYLIGVDLSSTAVRVLLLNLKGEIVDSHVEAIDNHDHILEILIGAIEDTISGYADSKDILSISISAPGNIDSENGVLLYLIFVPTWRNLPIRDAIEGHFHIPTFLIRDPDCVLIAEKYFGTILHENLKNVVEINLSYGVGMSLMINSKIYSSTNRRNGEFGHITMIPDGTLCNCGNRGCLEMYASRVGLVKQFVDALNRGEPTSFQIDSSYDITYETIRSHARAGDPLCLRLFRQAGEMLGRAFSQLASILDPDAIILYGELANDRDLFVDVMEESFRGHVYPACATQLLYSDMGGAALAMGAAFYALDQILDGFLDRKMAEDGESLLVEV